MPPNPHPLQPFWTSLTENQRRLDSMTVVDALTGLGIADNERRLTELENYIKYLDDNVADIAARGTSYAINEAEKQCKNYFKSDWLDLEVWRLAPDVWIFPAFTRCIECVRRRPGLRWAVKVAKQDSESE